MRLRLKNGTETSHFSVTQDKKDPCNLYEDRLCSHFVHLTPSLISSHYSRCCDCIDTSNTASYLSCDCDYDCAGWWQHLASASLKKTTKIKTYENQLQKLIGPERFSVLTSASYTCDQLTQDKELVAFNVSYWSSPVCSLVVDVIGTVSQEIGLCEKGWE